MLSRRLLCWAVLALVLVVGGALGQAAGRGGGIELTAPASAPPVQLVDGGGDVESPCVVRADCAGAGLFVGMGLLLAVAVAVPTIGAVVTVGRVWHRPRPMRSTLMAQRLLRPPQISS